MADNSQNKNVKILAWTNSKHDGDNAVCVRTDYSDDIRWTELRLLIDDGEFPASPRPRISSFSRVLNMPTLPPMKPRFVSIESCHCRREDAARRNVHLCQKGRDEDLLKFVDYFRHLRMIAREFWDPVGNLGQFGL